MTFETLRLLCREYASDTSETLDGRLVGDAVNRSQRTLGLIAEKIDPTLFVAYRTFHISYTGSDTIWALEHEIPDHFHRVVMFVDTNSIAAAGEIVPFSHWVRYAGSGTSLSLSSAVAYIRHDKLGTTVPDEIFRYVVQVRGQGSQYQRITTTQKRTAIGTSQKMAEETRAFRLMYSRYLDDLIADTEESEMPTEYHELIAIGAAMRMAAINNDPSFVRLFSRYKEGVGVMQQGLRSRRGELVA